jgi:hypothetical protein
VASDVAAGGAGRGDGDAVLDGEVLLDHVQLPKHERECQASSGAHVSSIKRDSTLLLAGVSENFLYYFKAAPWGRSRRRLGGRRRSRWRSRSGRPLAPVGWREDHGAFRWGRKPRKSRSRGGFDKGTLAAALIGLMRAGGSQPDSRTSVRAAAPCQIRRSVRAELPRCRWLALGDA